MAVDYDFVRAWPLCKEGPMIVDPCSGREIKLSSKSYFCLADKYDQEIAKIPAERTCPECESSLGNNMYCLRCVGRKIYYTPNTRTLSVNRLPTRSPQTEKKVRVQLSKSAHIPKRNVQISTKKRMSL